MQDDEALDRLYQLVAEGALSESDLSARGMAALLGKTTGALYHRWGSFDALLFAIGQRGFTELAALLDARWEQTRALAACAEAYVTFGLDHAQLYPLMFERRFDWAALRKAGAFERTVPGSELLRRIVCLLETAGSKRALDDTRLLMAGLHGIVSLAASGRMNTGALSSTDRQVAIASARDLATRILPAPPKQKRDRS
jgi:AcrR family transcriptional regulator